MSTQFLNTLLVSEIPEVVEAAQRAQQITARYEAEELTADEFKELIDDLVNIDRIDRSMITVEAFREIKQAFDIIMTLKSITSLL
ncbi:MAG: hypothetical protein CTY12_06350 [Methylotenera sp.]|nr:MAG: hypothetical protein CTY12_06350 [Methylotenera sp.]